MGHGYISFAYTGYHWLDIIHIHNIYERFLPVCVPRVVNMYFVISKHAGYLTSVLVKTLWTFFSKFQRIPVISCHFCRVKRQIDHIMIVIFLTIAESIRGGGGYWLPARWDCVFSGDHHQIAIIILNVYVKLIIDMWFVGNKAISSMSV